MNSYSRRKFLQMTAAGSAGLVLFGAGCATQPEQAAPAAPVPAATQGAAKNIPAPATAIPTAAPVATAAEQGRKPIAPPTGSEAYLSVIHGDDPAKITMAALAALGGIERFVKNGQDVIIKPNICTDYYPAEYAATTNPMVVATLVTLCLGAGAKRVRVMDMPFGGTPASAYAKSGIEEAVKAAGGEMEIMSPVKYKKVPIPQGLSIKECEVYQDILETDVLINVPIAKTHELARLTLGSKNMLGVITNPGRLHSQMGQRVADLVSLIRPTLTVIDAYRILVENGPTGGDLNDVKQANTIIASPDIIAADTWAAGMFEYGGKKFTGKGIAYIKAGAEMGLGTMDLSGIKIEEVTI